MIYIGKDLKGNELGKGIDQRKDGRYRYRMYFNGKRKDIYSWDLEYISNYRDEMESKISNIKNTEKAEKELKYIDELVKEKEGYVYFISDGQYCKIGKTNNIDVRLKILQCGSPNKLILLKSIKTLDCCHLENELHALFSKYHVRGEWYDILFLFQNDEIEETS